MHFPIKKGVFFDKTIGYVYAVDGVDLQIRRGETYGLVGESGCGKSTLGRAILNLEPPTEGKVVFDGTDIASLKGEELRRKRQFMQMVFQDPLSSLDPRQSVESLLLEGMKAHGLVKDTKAANARLKELLKAVAALGKPVVLVLLNGRPLSINWAAEHIPAILEAWEPGSEGGHAVADVIFGDVNPGGKLPVSFPRKGSHAPLYYARNLTHSPEGSRMYNPRYWDGLPAPLYPFGFGLSYTTFAFANVQLSAAQVKVGDALTVSVDVTNTGPVAGDEVAQLYIHQRWGSDSRPMRELKGFERVTLQPGATKTVTFSLGPDELGYWSTNAGHWLQEAAAFDLWVGSDSLATLHGEFEVIA